MSASEDDAAKDRLAALLDAAAAASRRIDFWWRDDDAETATPALDRLLQTAVRHGLPLGLAVVPAQASEALRDRLLSEAKVAVLQHGWEHRNHAEPGEKKIELGGARPLAETLDELRRGKEKLQALFPEKFLPVLVPPWNRIAEELQAARGELGLVGLSTYGPAPADDPRWVNTHLDIFAWKPVRRPLSRAEACQRLAGEIERRLKGNDEPVGILTHHLVHTEESWALLDTLFGLTARHPAVRWPRIGTLFRL